MLRPSRLGVPRQHCTADGATHRRPIRFRQAALNLRHLKARRGRAAVKIRHGCQSGDTALRGQTSHVSLTALQIYVEEMPDFTESCQPAPL
jgi:hypothetical protein